MKDDYVVVINEGEKTEKQIIQNIEQVFFHRGVPDTTKILSFKSNIYSLWNTWKKDDFDTNILELLMEKDIKVAQQISPIKKKIYQIYLFFDYDGHDTAAKDEIINEMVDKFNNETENGKIYISYPMVEALKDLQMKCKCIGRCRVLAKKNIHYKSVVAKSTIFSNLTTLNKANWDLILEHSVKKANCITSDCYQIPEYKIYTDNMGQKNIFRKQYEKYISPNQDVAVLSAFPFFLIDYFGKDFYNEIKDNQSSFDSLSDIDCDMLPQSCKNEPKN